MSRVVVLLLAAAFVTYRVSFSVRAARARRRGDAEGADRLSAHGSHLVRGLVIAVVVLFAIFLVLTFTHPNQP